MKKVSKICVKSTKRLLLFLLGNHLTTMLINKFKDALLTTRKFHSLTEICVSWILLTGFLIQKSILIFGRFVTKKKCGLHLINWTMKHRNGGKIFKSIESDEVSIQSTFDKEWKRVLIDLCFPNDYYDILYYISVDYKSVCSYEKQYVQNMEGQPQNQKLS